MSGIDPRFDPAFQRGYDPSRHARPTPSPRDLGSQRTGPGPSNPSFPTPESRTSTSRPAATRSA